MFFKELKTDRLYLKNISTEDRNFIFSQFSNEKVNQYLFDAEPLTNMQEADGIINFYIQAEPKECNRWILVRKDDGVKLGTCGFHCWDKSTGCCDIGYDLFPDYWGNGYMVEAIYAALDFARNEMGVKKINACVYVENVNSIKLAEKLGFVFYGQMKDEIFRGNAYPHKILTFDCAHL